MNTNLNVLSITPINDNQLEQILEKTMKKKPENDLSRALFDDYKDYFKMWHNGAAKVIESELDTIYNSKKKHLKNIRTVEAYLLANAAGDKTREKNLEDAKKQGALWTEIYVRSTIQKAIDDMRKGGLKYFSSKNFYDTKDEFFQLKEDVIDYPWTKGDFIYFMNASLDAYPDQLKTFESMLLHIIRHGPGFMIQKIVKEKYENEFNNITKKSDALQLKNESKIAKLTDDVKKQKEMIQSLQKKLSKKEHSFDLLKQAEKKQEQMKNEYEKQLSVLDAGFNLERKELLHQIEMLTEKNNSLYMQMNQYQKLLQDEKKIELNQKPLDLKKYRVIFMGGHPNLINKLREKYADWTYYNDDSINETLPNDADFLVYFTSCCSHTLFNRVQNWNKARKKAIHYAYANNIEHLEQSIQAFIYQEDAIPKITF